VMGWSPAIARSFLFGEASSFVLSASPCTTLLESKHFRP
jgi:hypothetical protein